MNISYNKLILIFSELIIINVFIIVNIILNKSNLTFQQNQIVTVKHIIKPKIGFGDLLAQTLVNPQVLGIATESLSTPTPIHKLLKNEYSIAIIGDSMIETMGDNLDYLQTALKQKYPDIKFDMYNYGIGSEKVTGGLERITKPFDRASRHYPPIPDLKPDILIVGSYAYNPFDIHDPVKHKNQLSELVNQARATGSKVYMLAEIAPLQKGFGTGPGGVNWPDDLANLQVQKIEEQMQNVFIVSKNLTVPLIDVYHKSLIPRSDFGDPKYVSTHDHIHPGVLGQIFTANIIADAIVLQ